MNATGLIALLLVGVVAMTTAVAAFGGFGNEDREEIAEALEEGDYETWQTLMNERHAARMTEEGFVQMQERHQERGVRRAEHEAERAEIDAALATGDYETWKAVVEGMGRPCAMIEEQDFATLVAMHNARESGDDDLADQLREELGLPAKGMGNIHAGGRMGGRMAGFAN